MTKIVAVAGKKQSGKTSSVHAVHGHVMLFNDSIKEYGMTEDGLLAVNVLVEDERGKREDYGVLDVNSKSMDFIRYAQRMIWPYVKSYSYADTLKDICIEVMGLDYEQCCGTDEQKNSLTNYYWEDMPGVITEVGLNELGAEIADRLSDIKEVCGRLGKYYDKIGNVVIHKPGRMTAREVMQFVGTEIFRRMNKNIWVENCLRQIDTDGTDLALIGDCRFVNEVEAVQKRGGKVIYLRRNDDDDSTHASENDLKNYKGFDAVIDNRNMSITDLSESVLDLLLNWGYISPIDYVDVPAKTSTTLKG